MARALALGLAVAVGAGCAALRQLEDPGPLTIRSLADGARLELRPTAAAAQRREDGALTAFATDIPPAAWSQPIGALEGSVVVVERFFAPTPGRTPMEASSSNGSVRWLVLARGAVGVYEGGAMVDSAGGLFRDAPTLRLRGATLRLGAASEGFVDALGPSEASGAFTANDDPHGAAALRALAERALAATRPLERP